MSSIIVGIVLIVAGLLTSIYNEQMLRTFGAVPFAEEYFRTSGGSRLFYILLGVFSALIGFMLVTGLFEGLVVGLLGPLFRL